MRALITPRLLYVYLHTHVRARTHTYIHTHTNTQLHRCRSMDSLWEGLWENYIHTTYIHTYTHKHTVTSLPFDGFAVGGSMGKLGDEMVDLVQFVTPQVPCIHACSCVCVCVSVSVCACVCVCVCVRRRDGRSGAIRNPTGTMHTCMHVCVCMCACVFLCVFVC
jgi:hypothetical protein